MDVQERNALEARVCAEVQELLAGGDQAAWRGVSHAACVEALEGELRFLGLYGHEDTETPAIIHEILLQHLAHWRAAGRGC